MNEPRWLDDEQQQAWRALLVFVNRGLPEIERTIKAHGLLAVHYTVLVELSDAPAHTLGLSELADMANVSQSRLTHRLRTLTEQGFVTIEPDPHDARAKNATLTASGLQWLASVAPHHAEDVQRLLFDHLTPAETRALANGLGKVAANLCEHADFQACADAEAGSQPPTGRDS